jgi:hypothetical protein
MHNYKTFKWAEWTINTGHSRTFPWLDQLAAAQQPRAPDFAVTSTTHPLLCSSSCVSNEATMKKFKWKSSQWNDIHPRKLKALTFVFPGKKSIVVVSVLRIQSVTGVNLHPRCPSPINSGDIVEPEFLPDEGTRNFLLVTSQPPARSCMAISGSNVSSPA